MIISQKFLKFICHVFQWHPKIAGRLYKYNANQGFFQVLKHKSAQRGYILRWSLLMAIALFYTVRISNGNSTSKKENGDNTSIVVERSMYFMALLICLFCAERYRVRGLYPTELTRFLNAAIQIETSCSQDAVAIVASPKFKLALIVMRIGYICCKYIFATCVPLATAFKPSLPLNTMWIIGFVLQDCKIKMIGLLSRNLTLVVSLLGNWLVWDIIASQGYAFTTEILTGTISLSFIQRVLWGRIQSLIRENNVENVTWMNALNQEIIAYRSFQITVGRFNQASRTTIVGFLIGSASTQIVSAYLLISNSSQSSQSASYEISPFMYAVYISAVIDTVLIFLGIYGFAGDIHHESVNIVESVKKLGKQQMVKDSQRRIYLERFIESCPPERIRFGAGNYIDKTTPLVFQLFCLDRLVDLLLLREQNGNLIWE